MSEEDVRDVLVFEVNRWLGVDYRYGGTSRSGFDCSGFVKRIFQDSFDASLPRTTREQMQVGTAVPRDRLQTADLVFFRTPARTDHVGVYLGGGEFAHASTSSGIMISHLDEVYWSNSYRGARRVLPLASNAPSKAAGADAEIPRRDSSVAQPAAATARVGW